jgi:hypothetical protein
MVMLFGLLAFAGLVTMFVTGGTMAQELQKRGVRIKWWAFRILIYGYAGRYRRTMLDETGEVPPLFRAFVISVIVMYGALAAALIAGKTS